ncbi:unnamed protein product [Prorocentrum cordatum]|uniref:Uncharacterized protein n=1 Tax=Prorocentrum cordatum TaxID=2364126 RepID=A0ABN9V036_9DINO|nr:unnamed protein product [Polarella glacialis]
MSGKRGGGGEHQGYRQSSVLDLRSCNADYSFPRSSRLARSAAGARVPRAAQARGHQLSASARRWRGSELAPPGARRNVTVPRKATQTWSEYTVPRDRATSLYIWRAGQKTPHSNLRRIPGGRLREKWMAAWLHLASSSRSNTRQLERCSDSSSAGHGSECDWTEKHSVRLALTSVQAKITIYCGSTQQEAEETNASSYY